VATLSATAAFKHFVTVFKPAITQALKRLQKLRGKKVSTWSRQRLESRRRKQVHKETPGG
jgi:diphthamide biosynthesis methyltransferase